ncbi:unnamed protein product [Prunus armeniaca]
MLPDMLMDPSFLITGSKVRALIQVDLLESGRKVWIGPNGIWARAPLDVHTGAYVKYGCKGGNVQIFSITAPSLGPCCCKVEKAIGPRFGTAKRSAGIPAACMAVLAAIGRHSKASGVYGKVWATTGAARGCCKIGTAAAPYGGSDI